ncbi:hypothetical protein GALMADRAFT_723155 [Galerina marginata CBS 339.88]|uniref:Uncharacterized protein n=1 Tax=Galerina marginata (strain CBS 339.88) TaxID=685588 RepID=A0A067SSY8_GALM3|nr:hypothetical protein GALMADRAFT_723155 [Galerina marginata CBS 339.88]
MHAYHRVAGFSVAQGYGICCLSLYLITSSSLHTRRAPSRGALVISDQSHMPCSSPKKFPRRRTRCPGCNQSIPPMPIVRAHHCRKHPPEVLSSCYYSFEPPFQIGVHV